MKIKEDSRILLLVLAYILIIVSAIFASKYIKWTNALYHEKGLILNE